MGDGGPFLCCIRKVIDSLFFICFCLPLCNYKQVLKLQYAMFSCESSQESLSVILIYTILSDVAMLDLIPTMQCKDVELKWVKLIRKL